MPRGTWRTAFAGILTDGGLHFEYTLLDGLISLTQFLALRTFNVFVNMATEQVVIAITPALLVKEKLLRIHILTKPRQDRASYREHFSH